MDTLRLGLPYIFKYLLNTYNKKTDHIARRFTEHAIILNMGRCSVHE